MSTFNQIMAMQKLTETIARMDLQEYRVTENDDALYNLIEEARHILKQGKKARRETTSLL